VCCRLDEEIGSPLPEMVFADNAVVVHHVPTGVSVWFTAADALRECLEPSEETLKVASASQFVCAL
jgi:hypothetical protein